ncbi:MAG: BrnT family toxin [Tabrizicola sp.]|uniref:BrnT family toxin n=1 Tax=Tabrizicola sp. TaxID=2005166 RepID=UPI003BB1B6B8
MDIAFDETKRQDTLSRRGLDMAEAGLVFAGPTITFPDVRNDYGETRNLTVGYLRGRMVSSAGQPEEWHAGSSA